MKVYRVEDPKEKRGLWRDFDVCIGRYSRKLREWFDVLDVIQMRELGYDVFELVRS